MTIKSSIYILFCLSLLRAQNIGIIAVFTLQSEGIDSAKSLIVADALRSEIREHKKIDVIEYQTMNNLLKLKGFEENYICNELVCAQVMGEFLAVEKIVQGSIVKKDNTYSINVRFVNLDKSENILDVTENYTGSFEGLLTESIPNIGKMIIKSSTKEIRKKQGAIFALFAGLAVALAVPTVYLLKPKEGGSGLATLRFVWKED